MSEVASSGRTVLFVSHNFAAVTALTKRAIVLNSGRVTFDGPVNDALAHYTASLGKGDRKRQWDRGLNSSLLSADLLDEQGRPADRYVPGTPLRLRIEFETTGLPGLSLEAVLRDHHHIAIAYYASNNFDQVLLPAEAGRYVCVLSLDSYYLAAGEYSIDLMTTVPNIMSDHVVENALRFAVDTCSPNGIPFNFTQELGLGNQAMRLTAPLRFTRQPSPEAA
jgi:lipopolysaccharide transport system ATP-binding protein